MGLLDNNTFVTADTDQTLSDLHCSSGSTMPNTGRWIAPNGNDLTNSTVDPFNIIQGDERDPGSLIIQQAPGHIITNSFQGVYSCVLPNDNGVLSYIYVGIYRNGFNCELTMLLVVLNASCSLTNPHSSSDNYISGINIKLWITLHSQLYFFWFAC